MNNSYKKEWEDSYKREENNILYPHDEVVKFLNRFVRKKLNFKGEFKDILDFTKTVKGLDFGCGVARSAILMEEFGIESYGVDISSNAIERAKDNASSFGYDALSSRLQTIDSNELPYEDNFFDLSIAESCLDSMSFGNASALVNEISRVTKKYIYFSVISCEVNFKNKSAEDLIVESNHEFGTIQSYYDEERIIELVSHFNSETVFIRNYTATGASKDDLIDSRFFVVLDVS